MLFAHTCVGVCSIFIARITANCICYVCFMFAWIRFAFVTVFVFSFFSLQRNAFGIFFLLWSVFYSFVLPAVTFNHNLYRIIDAIFFALVLAISIDFKFIKRKKRISICVALTVNEFQCYAHTNCESHSSFSWCGWHRAVAMVNKFNKYLNKWQNKYSNRGKKVYLLIFASS